MAKHRNPWDEVFDRIQIRRDPAKVYIDPPTDEELDALEAELGSRLPSTYRAFMKRFGSGILFDWVRFKLVGQRACRYRDTVAGETRSFRGHFSGEYEREQREGVTDYERHGRMVYFASTFNGDLCAWDPAEVVSDDPREYEVSFMPHEFERNPHGCGGSFWSFVEWVPGNIPGVEWDDTEHVFVPWDVRPKQPPSEEEVRIWLAWNDGTARTLAQVIRTDNRPELYPILADALEDAGCTNADVLNSCRHGFPESDGVWVLELLLGNG